MHKRNLVQYATRKSRNVRQRMCVLEVNNSKRMFALAGETGETAVTNMPTGPQEFFKIDLKLQALCLHFRRFLELEIDTSADHIC